jgi:thiol-disulfide isomerase/thioredoxin
LRLTSVIFACHTTMIKTLSFSLFLTLAAAKMISAQTVPVIHLSDLENMVNAKNDTVYVINFWATWCKPCVAELPSFEAANTEFANQKVKVILVCVNFAEEINSHVKPMIKKKGLKSSIVLLDETDANAWINVIAPEWSGAIPGTIFIRGNADLREFHEGEMSGESLNQKINQFLNSTP